MKSLLKYLLMVLFAGDLISCNKEETNIENYSFKLERAFDTIRSYPGGGGLFILKLNDTENQAGNVYLQIVSDQKLNATLTKNHISNKQPVFEVLIKPDKEISINDFKITVIGERNNHSDSLELNVAILDWNSPSELDEIAKNKKEAFIDWLNSNHPEININNQTDWYIYSTYPQIIIVNHFTLLNDLYEMRICNHVMIPPYDWSMIRLRRRNTFEPFLAVRQDSSDGLIYQIPIEEYPIKFGY